MRWIQLAATGSVVFDCPSRPSGAGTAVVKTVNGGELETVTPVLDSVSTTLSAATVPGASSVTVASATGISAGHRYLVDGAEDAGGEALTVLSVSSTTVTTVRRLQRAHASGATFKGSRLTFAITTASTPSPGRNFRVEWTSPEGVVTAIPFDVTRYAPVSSLTAEDLLDDDPQLLRRVAVGEYLPARIARAWDIILKHIAQNYRPGGLIGTIDLTIAHSYLVRALIQEGAGKADEAVKQLDDLRTRYTQERDNALGAAAYDENQTGRARNNQVNRTIRLVRG